VNLRSDPWLELFTGERLTAKRLVRNFAAASEGVAKIAVLFALVLRQCIEDEDEYKGRLEVYFARRFSFLGVAIFSVAVPRAAKRHSLCPYAQLSSKNRNNISTAREDPRPAS